MSQSEPGFGAGSWDVEALLSDALRPIEPPERLSGRLEDTLSAVTQAAAEELSVWAEQLSESELKALRDPRPLKDWPETLTNNSDAYLGEPFFGPWG